MYLPAPVPCGRPFGTGSFGSLSTLVTHTVVFSGLRREILGAVAIPCSKLLGCIAHSNCDYQCSIRFTTWGALLITKDDEGSSLLLYNPFRDYWSYRTYDEGFRDACCGIGLCDLYYERRPVATCNGYVQPFRGTKISHVCSTLTNVLFFCLLYFLFLLFGSLDVGGSSHKYPGWT